MVTQVFPYGTVELQNAAGELFKVNGARLKPYLVTDVVNIVETIYLDAP